SWSARRSLTPRSAGSANGTWPTGRIPAGAGAARSTTGTGAAACTSRTPTDNCSRSSPAPTAAVARRRRNDRARRAVAAVMAAGHQITIAPTGAHFEVTLGGEKLAESDRAVLLNETGYPTRYYIPREDVRTELLRPTSHHTTCPFKGEASYWSAEVGGEVHENVVWSYETPIPQAEGVASLMCFSPDRTELTVNGEHQPA